MKEIEERALIGYGRLYARALQELAVHLYRRISLTRRVYEGFRPLRLPSPVHSLLFVCKGNICRSPLAAAYFESLVEKGRDQMIVRSAGLETTPGKQAHASCKAVARKQQLLLDGHATAQVHGELLDQSDLIIVMELTQRDRLHRVYPKTRGKVFLLGAFDSEGPLEIADPYSGTIEDFRSCFQQVSRCCDALAVRLGLKSDESSAI